MTESQKGTVADTIIIPVVIVAFVATPIVLAFVTAWLWRAASNSHYISKYRDCVAHADADWCYATITGEGVKK